ncbi:MAG: hypothetical protein ACQESR_23330 [Planctomycetota bacterium]
MRCFRTKYCVGAILVFAVVGLVLLGVKGAEVARTERAIDAVERLGGVAYRSDMCFENGIPHGAFMPLRPPGWRTRCARAIGAEWFFDVVYVDFRGYRGDKVVTNGDLAILHEFSSLLSLDLADTEISDQGLKHVAGLTELRSLDLRRTSVTDAGLVHLAGLKRLEILHLHDTCVRGWGVDRLHQDIPGVMVGPMYESDWRKLSHNIDEFMKTKCFRRSRLSEDSSGTDPQLILE